jgi:hypothetical protein
MSMNWHFKFAYAILSYTPLYVRISQLLTARYLFVNGAVCISVLKGGGVGALTFRLSSGFAQFKLRLLDLAFELDLAAFFCNKFWSRVAGTPTER